MIEPMSKEFDAENNGVTFLATAFLDEAKRLLRIAVPRRRIKNILKMHIAKLWKNGSECI